MATCSKGWCVLDAVNGSEVCAIHAQHPSFKPADKDDRSFESELFVCPCCTGSGDCRACDGSGECDHCNRSCESCDGGRKCHRCEGDGVIDADQLKEEHEQQSKLRTKLTNAEEARERRRAAARTRAEESRVSA
jgi:hypothetical protein